MLGLTRNYWVVSAKAMLHNVECTAGGILHCNGRCCWGAIFWPAKANPDTAAGKCVYLGPQGCTLTMEQRPVTCLLYPLLVKNDRLLVHHRSRFKGVSCYLNLGQCDIPLVELFKPTWVHLFGHEQYEMLRVNTQHGQETILRVRGTIFKAYQRELQWEARNQVPKPRRVL